MDDRWYTTLAFLAQAVVSEPDQTEAFVAAVKNELSEASFTNLRDVDELIDVLDAITGAWRQVKRGSEEVSLTDIVEMARGLDDGIEAHRLASLALVSAAQEHLSRKQREIGLSPEERVLAERLPTLVTSGIVVA